MASKARRLTVALGTPTLETVGLSVKNFTGDSVFLAYSGLPANQPQSYKNFVAIWQASVIPWTAPPLEPPKPIGNNAQSGTIIIDGLTITSSTYVIGYGVGPNISNVCSSAVLNAGGLTAPPSAVRIGINYVGTDSISVSYETLSGYLPKTYQNWVGLWKGYASPYNAPAPIGQAPVPSDSSEGTVGINNVQLAIKTTYTLVYFVGPSRTEAAAILTFNTGDYAVI